MSAAPKAEPKLPRWAGEASKSWWCSLTETERQRIEAMEPSQLFVLGWQCGRAKGEEDNAALRATLEKCFAYLGRQIKCKTLNVSAADGTQELSRELAKLLDTLADSARPREDKA